MTSLENQLETAYARVAQANEPTLAETPFRLSTLILAQAPDPDDQSNESEVERVPVPYVLLTAKRGDIALAGNRGQPVFWNVPVVIEVADNAQDASADGGRLDALFQAVIRPLMAINLPEALSAAIDNFTCLAMPDCGDVEMENEGSIVKRMITATFICRSLEPA